MRILIIGPGVEDDILSRTVRQIPYLESKAFFAPHAPAIVAALTPPEHEVAIHDEPMRGPVDPVLRAQRFDVVGISLTTHQIRRCFAIADLFRRERMSGKLVVGGIGAGGIPGRLGRLFDAVFIGEAEQTWPRFLADLQAGLPRRVYYHLSKPDLTQAPAPRWELIAADLPRYGASSVQTTRGCPFDCSFCDVIYTYGRRARTKTVTQVLGEVRALEKLGARMIYLADDNFTGSRKYAKALLRDLAELNRSFAAPLSFMTQMDLGVARDDELLELIADAGLVEAQIGIESPEPGALRHMNKLQNLRLDPAEAVRKIQSYGILVLGHLIVGSDADDTGAFRRLSELADTACLAHHIVHPLMAPPGTRLWHELGRQERLVEPSEELLDLLDVATNIVPARMSRLELLEGLADYWESAYQPQRYLARALGFIRGVRRVPRVKQAGLGALWRMRRMLGRMVKFYGFEVPAEERRVFFEVLGAARRRSPELVPTAIFMHTAYMMDRERARSAARLAREQAARERLHPELVRVMRPSPVPFPELGAHLVKAAYRHIRPRVAEREALYRGVVEALIDYAGGAGTAGEPRLEQSCERVLLRLGEPSAGNGLAGGAPPAGFVREVRDAVDRTVRLRRQMEGESF
ncbi:MAG: B12-binding domain-containing radical SAM protein [Deltaproteobacteria bacterium]|nr:B12-binding domain-containing radical SAM protein [Deltaproteobacteria bacterium]